MESVCHKYVVLLDYLIGMTKRVDWDEALRASARTGLSSTLGRQTAKIFITYVLWSAAAVYLKVLITRPWLADCHERLTVDKLVGL